MALVLTATLLGSPGSADEGSKRYEQRGLDKCQAPTHAQAKAFWDGTVWWWWGIYIGGSNMACANGNVTAGWIDTELDRGYGIMPIWVGPQAPCTGYGSRFSYNATTAYNQGRDAAQNAYSRLLDLGFASNTPVAYDLEGFNTSNADCVAAARAFMRGWDSYLLQPPAQKPGVYGSSCASTLTSFWSIDPRPYFIWGANWDGTRDVYDMSCVSSSIFPRRHKQFRGEVNITENGVTLNVDVNCAQGPMYGRFDRTSTICR